VVIEEFICVHGRAGKIRLSSASQYGDNNRSQD